MTDDECSKGFGLYKYKLAKNGFGSYSLHVVAPALGLQPLHTSNSNCVKTRLS